MARWRSYVRLSVIFLWSFDFVPLLPSTFLSVWVRSEGIFNLWPAHSDANRMREEGVGRERRDNHFNTDRRERIARKMCEKRASLS